MNQNWVKVKVKLHRALSLQNFQIWVQLSGWVAEWRTTMPGRTIQEKMTLLHLVSCATGRICCQWNFTHTFQSYCTHLKLKYRMLTDGRKLRTEIVFWSTKLFFTKFVLIYNIQGVPRSSSGVLKAHSTNEISSKNIRPRTLHFPAIRHYFLFFFIKRNVITLEIDRYWVQILYSHL